MARLNPEKAGEIKEFIEKWRNYWRDNNQQYDEWVQFVMGSQWLDEEARVFDNYQKIPMTRNMIAPLKNHLRGEQLQNTPSLQVLPDESVPEQTAEVYEALIKDICFNPEAKLAYQTAFESAIMGGFGGYSLATEYDSDMTNDQHIVFVPEPIPTRLCWDVAAKSPCKTDGMACAKITRVSRKQVRKEWGRKVEANCQNETFEDGYGTTINDDDSITIIDYYERIYDTFTLRQLSNGRYVEDEEFRDIERIKYMDDAGKEVEMLIDNNEPVTIVSQRKVPRYKVKHYKFAGNYELEAADFPSKQLPIVFVDQNSYFDENSKQVCRPFFKDTYDAQRFINYIATQTCYLMKIARYDQFMASKENVRSLDTSVMWRDPTNVLGALLYDESPTGAKPEQLMPPNFPPFFIQQYEQAIQDIQNCTGMYQAQLGQQGNEISGVAVDARTKRGSYNTYTPFDSLNKAIGCGGTIVNEMVPQVYDTERTLNLNMPDKGETKVKINQPMSPYEGAPVINDMAHGVYKIRLVPGPSWEGQKQENLESMQQILQANPQLFNLMADLYVENLPMANSIQLRNRLRTIVPPEIVEAGKTGQPIPPKPPQPDPMVIAKMKELELKGQEVQMKQQKLQMDAQATGHDIQMQYAKLEAEKQEAAAQLQEMLLRYSAEMHKTDTDAQMNHANNLVHLLTAAHKNSQQHKEGH